MKYEELLLMMHFSVCSFLCLSKETNQRKDIRSLGPPAADFPALLEKVGRCETRPPRADSDSPRANPSFSVLLGCVKWHFKKLSAISNQFFMYLIFFCKLMTVNCRLFFF